MAHGGARPGAGRKTGLDEGKILKLKGIAVDWAIEQMQKGNDLNIQKDIVTKILGRIIPQTTELKNADGEGFKIEIITKVPRPSGNTIR